MIVKRSPIVEMFNIKYPIFQGGMAWISDASLAAAVSKAGGLGIIACGNAPGSWVKEQINLLKSMTDKPFGVNVMLLSPYAAEVAQIIADEKVPVIITGAGDPSRFMQLWKDSGALIVPVVPSCALAIRMERVGADAVIAEGNEAGGHIGQLSTMVLVPAVVNSVSIPVIAAGGICDSSTALAAFCLGAQAVQVGTRFILAKECNVHQAYKDKLIKAKDIDSKVTGRITGHPVRLIRSPIVRKMMSAEYEDNAVGVLEALGEDSLRKAAVDGNIREGSFMAGQCACLLKEEMTAQEIIEDIFSDEKIKALVEDIKTIIEI